MNSKKDNILLAFERLIDGRDLSSISIRDIAKEAEVNLSMISYYFGSKELLVQSLIHSRLELVIKNLNEAYLKLEEGVGIKERATCIVSIYMNTMGKYKGLLAAVSKSNIVIDHSKDILLKHYEELTNKFIDISERTSTKRSKKEMALLAGNFIGSASFFLKSKVFYDFVGNNVKERKEMIREYLEEMIYKQII